MEKTTKIMANVAVGVTAIWFFMALFGLPGVSWKMVFMPIPLALVITIVMYSGRSIYEQIKRK